MIYYDYTITVKGNKASLNKNIYLYRRNLNIDYYFKVIDASFVFKEVDRTEGATQATIKMINPSGKKIASKPIRIGSDNKIHLRIQEMLIDDVSEVGSYTFQIDLYDSEGGRVTIPPVEGQLIVLEPLFDDGEHDHFSDEDEFYDADSSDTRVGIAKVGVNRLTAYGEDISIEYGNGVKIDWFWQYGDIITVSKFNEMINAINGAIDDITYLNAKQTETSQELNEKYEELLELINDFECSGDHSGGTIEIPDDWKDFSHIIKTNDGQAPDNKDAVWLDLSDDGEDVSESELDLLWAYIETLENRIVALERTIENGIVTKREPALLLETGGYLLLENGGRLLLE
jgi:hypothetical protein